VENQIKWTGGTAVSGNNAERNYSLATSQKYTIDPTLAGHDWAGHNVYLWVIWATVTIDDTGTDPADAPKFPPPPEVYNGQNLGIQYDAAKDAVDFSNCQEAQMTPSGIHNVISGGCVMKQQREIHVFANVTQHGQFWDTGWTADGPASGNYTTAPDSGDKVYAIDSPTLHLVGTDTQDDEYGDFRDWEEWDGTTCSDYAYWYFEAGAKATANPQIYFAQGGTGQITIPNTDPQAAENPN
jgi:hypothetical protein